MLHPLNLPPLADCRCRRHFDTAEVYKSGALAFGGKTSEAPPGPIVYNESQLGKFFATVPRDSFTVASKFMPLGKPDSSYETVKAALTASLERLGLEYVDLYYSHRVLSREQGIEYVTAARRLQEEGLIKHIGLSEVSALGDLPTEKTNEAGERELEQLVARVGS